MGPDIEVVGVDDPVQAVDFLALWELFDQSDLTNRLTSGLS